ncbi:MAG: TonB-dependent receptor [Ignavibacteriaceae bacterium]|nr:TonB-dependent receptor [Ignavibacteriaceae bacterium]
MIKRIIILLLFAVINSTHFLIAQESDSVKTYSLSDVVIVANRFENNVRDISTKVEVISEKKIQKLNGNRLPDIIKNSSSVFVKSYGSTPSLQTISINGLGAEHTLILLDGVKLNSFQNSVVDLSLIPIENISRIEVLNNGASSIYGSEAIGGVINIITSNKLSNNSDNDLQLKVGLSGGSYNTFRYSLGLYQKINSFDARIFYNKEKSDGSFNYYYDDGINITEKERQNAAYSIYDIGLNSQYIFDDYNRLKFISTYSDQDKQVPGIETGTPPAKTTQTDKNWNNILISENIVSTNYSFITSFNFQNNLMNYDVEPLTHSFYKNIVYSVSPELRWKNEDNNIVLGYNYSYGSLASNEVDSGAIRNIHSVYLSTGLLAAYGFRVYPSARYDHYSDLNEDVLTYKIGINYQPFSKVDLSFKANAGNNFRAPTFNDLYWKESGNKDLKSESSFNAEAGIIYFFNLFFTAQFEFTYTYILAKDKIVWTPQRNFIWTPINIAQSESNNYLVNLSLTKEVNEDITIGFESGINFTTSKKTSESFQNDPTNGKYFPYLPLQTIKSGLMLEYRFIGFNLFYIHTGKRFSDFENKKSLNPYNILDGNISIYTKIWEVNSVIKFELNNITNTSYETISGYPMPLGNFMLTLTINY